MSLCSEEMKHHLSEVVACLQIKDVLAWPTPILQLPMVATALSPEAGDLTEQICSPVVMAAGTFAWRGHGGVYFPLPACRPDANESCRPSSGLQQGCKILAYRPMICSMTELILYIHQALAASDLRAREFCLGANMTGSRCSLLDCRAKRWRSSCSHFLLFTSGCSGCGMILGRSMRLSARSC